MTIPAEVRVKFYALQALAAALCALTLVAFFERPNSSGFLLLGIFALTAGNWLVRRSNTYVWRARVKMVGAQSPAKAAGLVGPVAWSLLAAWLVGLGLWYRLARLDTLGWYKMEWPTDVVFGVFVAWLIAKVYLAKKLPR